MIKEGDKRIKDNGFEQVERCQDCDVLFWAKSEWELGNWQVRCSECSLVREKLEQERIDHIKTEGKEIFRNKQVYCWFLGDHLIYNEEYEYPKSVDIDTGINESNIDDLIRDLRKQSKKCVIWHPYLFDILLNFMKNIGSEIIPLGTIRFMGIDHKEGEWGDYEYLVAEEEKYLD